MQVSVTALLVVDAVLLWAGGVPAAADPWPWIGLGLSLVLAVLVLLGPALTADGTWGARGVAVVCVLDLAAIGLVRLAPEQGGATLLVILPAIWLGAWWGRAGALLAGISAALLVTAPGLLHTGAEGAALASNAPVPGLSFAAAFAVSEGMRRAERARARAAAYLTEKEQAIADLRAETGRIQTILATTDTGLLLIDGEGTVVYANATAEHALALAFPQGRDTRRLDQRDAASSEAFSPDGSNYLLGDLRPATRLARGEEFSGSRAWVGPEGARRLLLVSGRLTDPGDPSRGGVIAFSDITDQDRSRRVRTSFLSTVAHELRTPLMSLENHLSLLRDVPDLSDEVLELLPALERSSSRLARLGAQLIDDVDTSGWHLQATRETVDLTDLVSLACERSCPGRAATGKGGSATAESCQVVQHLEPGVHVRVDRALVESMLDALLSHACEHAAPGTPVTVGLFVSASTVELTVSHLGTGIDSSRHLALFEPTQEMLAEGGELSGLPLCRAVAGAHEGHVDIDSSLGSGTTLVVRLPIVTGG